MKTTDNAAPRSVDKTSQTDDQRIQDITVLPPPEHLMRFFPIAGTAVEKLIDQTRKTIHRIVAREIACWSSSVLAPSMTRLRRLITPAASSPCAITTRTRWRS